MTPAEAAAAHPHATAGGSLVIWFVTLSDLANPDRAVAQASNSGGYRLFGELVADTVEEVRAMLPPGLTLSERSGLDPARTVEVWH